jgi:SagB-type dehydrogenase family enzyme
MDEDPYIQSAKVTQFLGWGEAERPAEDDPAETFHEASKNVPGVLPRVSAATRDLTIDPTVGVPGATISRSVKRNLALPTIEFPAPEFPTMSVGEAIGQRRSRRHFGHEPLSLLDVSTLLHAAYGVTGETEIAVGRQRFRSVPSGGGLYPLEIYPVIKKVEGVPPGLYHYDPFRHLLEEIRQGEVEGALAEMLIPLPQLPDIPGTCAVVFFVVGIFWRTRFKYAFRGYRWVMIEAGHVGQNLVLAAESLGLSLFPNGGFWDRKVDAYLGLDGVNESVVYSLVAGSSADGEDRSSSDGSNLFS